MLGRSAVLAAGGLFYCNSVTPLHITMNSRRDVKPSAEAPRSIKKLLLKIGGKTPFGEPNWRLTLASGTMWLRPAGNPPTEMGWFRRYPGQRYPGDREGIEGWILQEWQPACIYGSQDDWYKQHVAGRPDLCRAGEYPVQGDYELKFPFGYPEMPSHSVLQLAVNYAERSREFWGSFTPQQRFLMRENVHAARMVMQEQYIRDRDLAMIRDCMSPLWSSSLAAGRWREELAKKAGLSIGHVGN